MPEGITPEELLERLRALPDPAAADKLLCFCTSTPSCNATLADDPASAHGSCEIGVAGCARGDATWCSEFCR